MGRVGQLVLEGLAGLDQTTAAAPPERLVAAVVLACQVFELVLRIHPYVNGNWHVARFVLLAILGRYGYWPRDLTIDPRPGYPDYLAMIIAYRDGNPRPLEEFILRSIVRR